jgi:hypothetical protein
MPENTQEAEPNAEGVRQFQPRVELWQPWGKCVSLIEGATLKGLRRARKSQNRRNSFRVATKQIGTFYPRVPKPTLGWN